jgi:predicted glycogen debranching enzyme
MAVGGMTQPRGWPIRTVTFAPHTAVDLSREWLVTNGLGGFASGVVAGGLTRRYHGLLVAAHPAPVGRVVHVAALRIAARTETSTIWLDHEDPAVLAAQETSPLQSFHLEAGLPVWKYAIGSVVIERRIFMPRGANTTIVWFRRLAGSHDVELVCEPVASARPLHASLDEPLLSMKVTTWDAGLEIEYENAPTLRLVATSSGKAWRVTPGIEGKLHFASESARGYHAVGRVDLPGSVELTVDDKGAALWLSTDADRDSPIDAGMALHVELDRRAALLERATAGDDVFTAELVLAADQFIVAPVGHASGIGATGPALNRRSVIAGYHWFTDWGRDTMISLDGLTLATGRHDDAAQMLRLFAGHVYQGLIPNLFPEGQRLGLYHTADATLWFFEAAARYTRATGDRRLLHELLPTLVDILHWHRRGTSFGIGVDPEDGLLVQGAEGFALTWMDAKMDGWVVTPRRGKAVEINALWFNAVSLAHEWLEDAQLHDEAMTALGDARRAQDAFNRRFWNPATGWLFDVVDGEGPDDPRCRPNQVLAISLSHAVLDPARWSSVLGAVGHHLLTPLGLRTLAPDAPGYQSQYAGDLRTRDGAYHQGTVWPWLIGPYVDALLKADPDRPEQAWMAIAAFPAHLSDAGMGSISEICDADPPHLPRGCIAQAWSVAEVLRVHKRLRDLARTQRALPV